MSGERWFQRLLRLLPFDFRADYGDEMRQVFREQRRDAAGPLGEARVWMRTAGEILSIGPREHLAQLRQDVTYAFRGMRRQPGFVTVVILTLALGIGANTAIFGVLQAVLLEPLPYGDPARLVSVWNRWEGRPAVGLSDPEYLDYAERSRTLSIAAAAPAEVNVSGGNGEPERVGAAQVTVNMLDVLGVSPAIGRPFRPDDERAGQDRVVLLSHAFWHRRFAGDRSIAGKTIGINGEAYEVAGVLPEGFMWPTEFTSTGPVHLALPLRLDRSAARNSRGGHYLHGIARLAGGQTLDTARAEMGSVIASLIREYPDQHVQGNFGVAINPLRQDLLGEARPVVLFLAAAVGLVLLIACANVANLLLARGEARRRELAVRTALGASRWRIARQLLTESCVLSLAGAAAGLLVAFWLQRLVTAVDPSTLPRLDHLRLSVPALVFAAALGCITGLLFGLAPAFQISKAGTAGSLKDGARGGTEGARATARRALVVCQVSIAVVLVVAGGLLTKSFARVVATPAGIDPGGVLTLRVSAPQSRYPGRAEVTAFFDRVLERVRALPGVGQAGAASGLPLSVASGDWSFDIEGRPRINGRRPGAADWYVVTPGYFETLGIEVVRGRLPSASDTEDATPVVFINETTARTLFQGDDPIGRRIRFGGSTYEQQPWRTIAGVVRDVRTHGLDQPLRTEVFFPHRQFLHFARGAQARAMSLVIKTPSSDPLLLASAIRAELRGIDPQVAAADVRDMEAVVSGSVASRRLYMILVGSFGTLALALAAIGLYGVMAFHVVQRTREMGVRLALGASRTDVLALVVFQGMRLVLIGLAAGTIAALGLTGPMRSLLHEVSPRDAAVFAAGALMLAGVGLLACYIPARRATHVDPVVALRAE
jgi:putative ABC transport system permease protein